MDGCWLCVTLAEHRLHLLWSTATAGRIFLFGLHVEVQVGQNDFQQDNDKSFGFFAIVSESEGAFLYVCPGSQNFVFYSDDARKILDKT